MVIETPWLHLRGPLKSQPVKGLVVGAAIGFLFAILSKDVQAALSRAVVASVLGGAAAGLVIDACLPFFRRRAQAGILVASGVSVGFLVSWYILPTGFPPLMSLFLGFCSGFIYAVLFWSYSEPSEGMR